MKSKLILGSFLAFSVATCVAQNTSYNQNTIPLIPGNFNTGVGNQVLQMNTGNENTATGHEAMFQNNPGNYNTSAGFRSLYNNVSGDYNTALGYLADVGGTGLTNATAIGANAVVTANNAIQLGDAGVTQVFCGVNTAATFITGGIQITGGSPVSGQVLTTNGSGVGTWQTLSSSSIGGWSTLGNSGTVDGTNFIGTTDNVPFNIRANNQKAGRIEINGNTANTFYGYKAGNAITSGIFNTAAGYESLMSNTGGSSNTAFGYATLKYNTTGYSNTAYGIQALRNNTTGYMNAGFGILSLDNNLTGYQNTGLGMQTLYMNSTGNNNTASGMSALFLNTTGSQNTASGFNCMYSNTSGGNNTAEGFQALFANTTGWQNVATGVSALAYNTSGHENAAVGFECLMNNTTGYFNTAIGYHANTFGNAQYNSTALGYNAVAMNSNDLRLGNTTCTLISGNPAVYTGSDARFKTNVSEEDVVGLDFIKRLRPVVYNFDTKKQTEFITKNMPDSLRKHHLADDFGPSTAIRQSGFIAQEVEKAAEETGYNFHGVHRPQSDNDYYSLAYSTFVVPLVKAVQEQQQMIESMKQEIKELRNSKTVNAENKTAGVSQLNQTETIMLEQNIPNPFTNETVIKYTLPQEVNTAYMAVYDLSGKQVTRFVLNPRGSAALTITSEKLAAGMYIYSIIADGVILDSKRMVVAEK